MRDWMIEKRKALGISFEGMAKACSCSLILLELIEGSDYTVTHPKIAARIAHAYKMDVEQYNSLVNIKHHAKKLPKPTPPPPKKTNIYKMWRENWRGI